MKKPLHWAHVLYDEESLISYALANLTFLPYFIVFGHACVLLFRRDLTSLFFWVGYWANEIINSALKFTFRQERPLSEQAKLETYGMPSAHSQLIFFWATFSCWMLLVRITFQSKWSNYLLCFGIIILASLVSFSRWYLGYHTLLQVVIGGLVGILFGSIWFGLLHLCVSKRFHVLEQMTLLRLFYFTDVSTIPNILNFDYNNYLLWKRTKRTK